MCAQVTCSLAKRKEQPIHVIVALASPSWNPADAPVTPYVDDDVIASEEELRAWSELERPETPSRTSRSSGLPKRYQGVLQERYILIILVLVILLFIAASFQTDTKTELEEIKRMYHVDESIQPVPHRKYTQKS
ncbi:hypothetical protein ABB37_05284 [Leptomonas pyrrhocoris]|uniref:Transmembrane protein n=1 Tax=Leptomonas pyrrhocoris TaxID=157538 RepID=A0A0M9G050_LEPPY|nr:hypothetical protein ABB37_05284 [Leptomonas pyrrhocoris]KPA79446.1 hypothetical protein ABB37_05284 [Leptomonas pyrrhocoris]|eukprot:XP_015657885.1 hypothetical protein ABB37_05284 [Leptomonas pyrrhocoris]